MQTISEFSKKTGLSDRRIRLLCAQGRIPGAIRIGRQWTLPDQTVLPDRVAGRPARLAAQALPKRKSEHLGLSQPYDWSNPDISDDVLISKVLERYRFEDVARVALHYGIARCSRQVDAIQDPYRVLVLKRMMANIERGLADASVNPP